MNKKEEVLVSYGTEENKKKLEDYIYEKTCKRIDLGPLAYGGKGSIWIISSDLKQINGCNVTGAINFPGKRFKDIDKFIEWHESLQAGSSSAEERQKPRITAQTLKEAVDEECRKRSIEPIKDGNKTGTKVTVRFSLPEEKSAVFSDKEKNR